jgi:hypothetical protein
MFETTHRCHLYNALKKLDDKLQVESEEKLLKEGICIGLQHDDDNQQHGGWLVNSRPIRLITTEEFSKYEAD